MSTHEPNLEVKQIPTGELQTETRGIQKIDEEGKAKNLTIVFNSFNGRKSDYARYDRETDCQTRQIDIELKGSRYKWDNRHLDNDKSSLEMALKEKSNAELVSFNKRWMVCCLKLARTDA